MTAPTQEQLKAIKEIAKGKYGIWSYVARSIIDEDEVLEALEFIKEFKEQYDDPATRKFIIKRYPQHIINALK